MKVRIKSKASAGYTASLWIEGGGLAIATDPAPTTVTLASLIAAGRVFYSPAGTFHTTGRRLDTFCIDGNGTITIRLWWYDDVEQLWVPAGAPGSATPQTTTNLIGGSEISPSVKHYIQIVSNAAGTTRMAVCIR
jgi:hypothetical protein